MNILIVCNHFAVCSGRYAADAFTRLGQNVRHVGQPMGRHIWGVDVPAEYVWTPDTNGDAYPIPDLIIVMDSDPAVLDDAYGYAEASQGSPVVVWGVDNHVRDYRRPYFDHYFLAHKSVSVMPWNKTDWAYDLVDAPDGRTHTLWHPKDHDSDMTWLPCAYDPVAFPPSPIPWERREYDVCMIGVMYPKRWELVNAMRAAGLRVLAGSGLIYEAYRDAYHNSRVALVSSFNGDLPIRLFEGAGMGCAVLCDEIADLDQFGEHIKMTRITTYHSVDDAVNGAKYLQGREDKAKACLEWAKPHTWDARAQVIVDWMEARS